LPFIKMSIKDKTYVSWVGLRGAVPIIFAILPLVENVPHARIIFNIVFFSTLVSLIVQGTTLSLVAGWLGLAEKQRKVKRLESFDVDFSSDIKSITTEIEVTTTILERGNHLMDLPLPDNTLVVMIKRNGNFFVPTGKTLLKEKDNLLIITDNQEALFETYEMLGVPYK